MLPLPPLRWHAALGIYSDGSIGSGGPDWRGHVPLKEGRTRILCATANVIDSSTLGRTM